MKLEGRTKRVKGLCLLVNINQGRILTESGTLTAVGFSEDGNANSRRQ